MTTVQLRKACEDGSLSHDMAFEVAQERDASVRALREAIRAQGEQFKLREFAEAEVSRLKAAIKKAPHPLSCNVQLANNLPCDCWKAEALR